MHHSRFDIDMDASVASLQFDLPVVAHDALIVWVFDDVQSSAIALGDALGDSFVNVVGPVDVVNNRSYIAAAFDVKGGANKINVSLSAIGASLGTVGLADGMKSGFVNLSGNGK